MFDSRIINLKILILQKGQLKNISVCVCVKVHNIEQQCSSQQAKVKS
jgi:hypothetical protein